MGLLSRVFPPALWLKPNRLGGLEARIENRDGASLGSGWVNAPEATRRLTRSRGDGAGDSPLNGERQWAGGRKRSPANCGSGVTDSQWADAALIPGETVLQVSEAGDLLKRTWTADRPWDWPIELVGQAEQRQFQHQMATQPRALRSWPA